MRVRAGDVYLDATFGGGGHTERILKLGGRVVGLDVDQNALENAIKKFSLQSRELGVWVTKEKDLTIYKSNFKDIDQVAKREKIAAFSGIILDLGVSSYQLDTAGRGFSFSKEGKLDMRMDRELQVNASDLLNALNEGELYELFTKLGGESSARSISRNIIRYRLKKKIETTTELAEIIRQNPGRRFYKKGVDQATKAFMALRIAVNDELNNLREVLPKAEKLLKKKGRLAVISFHSLEDRIVKDFFKASSGLEILTSKPLEPMEAELKSNPRSRSARLRVAEKIIGIE